MLIMGGSIVLNAMLALGVVNETLTYPNVNVSFYYNSIIQTHIHFFNNFKRIYHQIKQNQLQRVGLKSFALILLEAHLSLPQAKLVGFWL
jgi:dihydroxyacid dehydratase/phosphogluconate dehydratase